MDSLSSSKHFSPEATVSSAAPPNTEGSHKALIFPKRSRGFDTPLSGFDITTTDHQNLVSMGEIHDEEITGDGGFLDPRLEAERMLSPGFVKIQPKLRTLDRFKLKLPKLCVKTLVSTLLGLESLHETFVFISYQRLQDSLQELKTLNNQLLQVRVELKKTGTKDSEHSVLEHRKQELKNEIKQAEQSKLRSQNDYQKDRSDFSRLVSGFQHQANNPECSLDIKTAGVIVKQEGGDIEITNLHLTINALDLVEQREGGDRYVEAVFKGDASFHVRVPLFNEQFLSLNIKATGSRLAVRSGIAKLLNLYRCSGNILSLIARGIGFAASGAELMPSTISLSCDSLIVEMHEGGHHAIARLLQKALSTPESMFDDLFTKCPIPLKIHIGQLEVVDSCNLGVEGGAIHLVVSLNKLPEENEIQMFPRTLSVTAESGSVVVEKPVDILNTTLNLVVPETIKDQEVEVKQIIPEQVKNLASELMDKGTLSFSKTSIKVIRKIMRTPRPADESWNMTGDASIGLDMAGAELKIKGELDAQIQTGQIKIEGDVEGESVSLLAGTAWVRPDLTVKPIVLPVTPETIVAGGVIGKLGNFLISITSDNHEQNLQGELGAVELEVKEAAPIGVLITGSNKTLDNCIQLNEPSYLTSRQVSFDAAASSDKRSLKLDTASVYLRFLGDLSSPRVLSDTKDFSGKFEVGCKELELSEMGSDRPETRVRTAGLKSACMTLDDGDAPFGFIHESKVDLCSSGTGTISTVEVIIEGDRLLESMAGLSQSRLAWCLLSGINLELSFEIPVSGYGIKARDLKLLSIHAAQGRGCNLGVYRATLECLLRSLQYSLGYQLDQSGQLVITLCGCKVARFELPHSLVSESAIMIPPFLTDQAGVVVKDCVPEEWLKAQMTNTSTESLSTFLDYIEKLKPPISVSNRSLFLASIPVGIFIDCGDKILLTRMRDLCGKESGMLVEKALELTINHKMSVPEWLIERVKQLAFRESIPLGIAGRFLHFSGDKENAFILLSRSHGQDEVAVQLLVTLQRECALKCVRNGSSVMAQAWCRKMVEVTEKYYREGCKWAQIVINDLAGNADLASTDAILLQCSHILSGPSGFVDINNALTALSGLYKQLVVDLKKEQTLSNVDPLISEKDIYKHLSGIALKRIINIINQRYRNVGCVFIHPENVNQTEVNRDLMRRISTQGEVKDNELYKAAVCYLFGLEGFPFDEHIALYLLNSENITGHPPVKLLLKMLGEEVLEDSEPEWEESEIQSSGRVQTFDTTSLEGVRNRKPKPCKVS